MIKEKSYLYITGSSGTGKSTRVEVLIKHLMTKFDSEEITHEYTTKAGNILEGITGIFFPEINTIFFSRPTIKRGTGEEGWNGMDTLKVGSPDNKMDFIDSLKREHNDKNVVVEEYGGFAFRNRPNHVLRSDTYDNPRSKYKVATGLGFDREMIVIVSYENFEQAKKRISERGGKEISEDSRTWEMNSLFKNIRKSLNAELEANRGKARLVELSHDDSTESIKDIWLEWMEIK